MLSAEYQRRIVEKAFFQIADVYERKLKDRGLSFDDVEYFQCYPLRGDLALGPDDQFLLIPSWRFMLYWQLKNGQAIRAPIIFYGSCPIGELWNEARAMF